VDNQTNLDVAPEPKPRPARRLEYDDARHTGISRRQMNVFLLLLFINTLLFAAFICLPNVSPLLKDLWSNWQNAREAKRVAQQLRTAIDACLTFTLPPDQVVYAEAPAEIGKLLAGAGRAHEVSDLPPQTGGGGGSLFGMRKRQSHEATDAEKLLPQSGWREAVVLGRPEPMRRLDGRLLDIPREYDVDSVVFFHQLKAPSGKSRLVWISVDADQSLKDGTGDEHAGILRYLETDRTLNAVVYNPDDLHAPTLTTIHFAEAPDARPRVVYFRTDDGVLRVKPWEPRGLWRVLAGQPDPNDPTNVTIPYDIDGKPGVIDARLGDGDRLMFTPRAGHLVQWTGSNTYTWDLTTPSTTQPAK
jgi:hypothetical protein